MKHYFNRMKPSGVCPPRKPVSKIIWSWIGAFVGIYLVALIGKWTGLAGVNNVFLIGSFGASAVLVYGAPMADFSQPRNIVGGHFFSAIVGVTIYMLIKDSILASATAVSLAIVTMHFSRTLHPPGGATALIAVIGGDKIHQLGYAYVLYPVLSGAVIMMLVALLVNNLSTNPKRHYPVYWV
jgi:CBS domain-containing membrane protein